MTICIEWFILQNLSMDALILWLAARLASIRVRLWRVAAASALGCGYAVCAYLPWGGWLLGIVPRIVVCFLMTALLCAPRLRQVGRTVRAFVFIVVATFLLGGTGAGLMYMLGAKGYSAGTAVATAVLGGALCVLITVRRNRTCSAHRAVLRVCISGRFVRMDAVVDTGNVLVEPLSNLPVIVAERRALRGMEQGQVMRAVPFTSVGGTGELEAFFPDGVWVDGRQVDACLAVYDGSLSLEGHALIPGRLVAFRADKEAIPVGQ